MISTSFAHTEHEINNEIMIVIILPLAKLINRVMWIQSQIINETAVKRGKSQNTNTAVQT